MVYGDHRAHPGRGDSGHGRAALARLARRAARVADPGEDGGAVPPVDDADGEGGAAEGHVEPLHLRPRLTFVADLCV